jgi:hypothetical protein
MNHGWTAFELGREDKSMKLNWPNHQILNVSVFTIFDFHELFLLRFIAITFRSTGELKMMAVDNHENFLTLLFHQNLPVQSYLAWIFSFFVFGMSDIIFGRAEVIHRGFEFLISKIAENDRVIVGLWFSFLRFRRSMPNNLSTLSSLGHHNSHYKSICRFS